MTSANLCYFVTPSYAPLAQTTILSQSAICFRLLLFSFPPPWTLYHVNFPKKRAEVQTKLIQDSSHVAPVCLDALTFEVLCSWKKVPTAASKPLTSISVYYLLEAGAGYYAQLLGPLLISTCESTMLGCCLCRKSRCLDLKYVHVLRYKINPT